MYAAKPAEEEGGAEGHSTSISADTRNQPVELLNRSNGRTPSRSQPPIHDLQELQLYRPHRQSNNSSNPNSEEPVWETELRNRPRPARRPTGSSTAIDVDYDEFEHTDNERISEHLLTLVNGYARSLVALRIKDEISQAVNRYASQGLI